MSQQHSYFQRFLGCVLVCVITVSLSSVTEAAKLGNICRLYGEEEVKLTGIGLVIGLSGTGDGGKSATTMRSLGAALRLLNNPTQVETMDYDNVAVVMIDATIPATGLSKGQKVDCYVSSPFGAKSLRGGRLWVAPMESALISNDQAIALASGGIVIEDEKSLTAGKIPGGVSLLRDVYPESNSLHGRDSITLLIDKNKMAWTTSYAIAQAIHEDFSSELSESNLSEWISTTPTSLTLKVPEIYRSTPAEFVANLMNVSIDNPNTEGKVIVNNKTNTIIITGEVELSPVTLTHENINISVGNSNTPGRFVNLDRASEDERSPQLKELEQALRQIQVPAKDIISIIRELHRTGKLHGIYEEH